MSDVAPGKVGHYASTACPDSCDGCPHDGVCLDGDPSLLDTPPAPGPVDQQRAALEEGLAVLRRIEWNDTDDRTGVLLFYCPLCHVVQRNGHKPDCKIGRAIVSMSAALQAQ